MIIRILSTLILLNVSNVYATYRPTITTGVKYKPSTSFRPRAGTTTTRVVTRTVAPTVISPVVVSPFVPAAVVGYGYVPIAGTTATILLIFICIVVCVIFFMLWRAASVSSTSRSNQFRTSISTFPQPQQELLDAFRYGPHGWSLDSYYTGVIISDVILNGQYLGFKLLFDDQTSIYVAYGEMISLCEAAILYGSATLIIPQRLLLGQEMFDSLQASYEINFDPITRFFAIYRTRVQSVPSVKYVVNGLEMLELAN